jgi:hypothetical protein
MSSDKGAVAAGLPVQTLRVQGILKPLEIEVVSGGRVVRIIKIPDPREKFIKAWNQTA